MIGIAEICGSLTGFSFLPVDPPDSPPAGISGPRLPDPLLPAPPEPDEAPPPSPHHWADAGTAAATSPIAATALSRNFIRDPLRESIVLNHHSIPDRPETALNTPQSSLA
jgi:hypothetical protein